MCNQESNINYSKAKVHLQVYKNHKVMLKEVWFNVP